MTKKVYVKTFGCQMNEYDSDKMVDVLGAAHGLTQTDSPEDADVIWIIASHGSFRRLSELCP